jgi:hypothetical protein
MYDMNKYIINVGGASGRMSLLTSEFRMSSRRRKNGSTYEITDSDETSNGALLRLVVHVCQHADRKENVHE